MPIDAFFVNVRRHDADLALARRNDARTVRPDQPRAPVLQELPGAHHVERRNAFGDADDQFDLGVGGLHDGVGRERRRHEDHRGIRAGLVDRFLHGVEDRPALVRGAALAGVTPPTILVPYSAQALAWNVPSRPVRPCTITRVIFIYQNCS